MSEQLQNPEHSEATNYFVQARTALKNGNIGLAEQNLKRALELWPDNYNYVLQLAKVTIQLERPHREVEELLLKSSSLNITATEPRLLMATHYEKLGQQQRAISIYKGVLNIDPNNLIVRRKLGQIGLDLNTGLSYNSLTNAVALTEESTSQFSPSQEYASPAPEPVHSEFKNILLEGEDWDHLIESIQRDTNIMQVDGRMRIELGNNYLELGLYTEAIQEFQEAYDLLIEKQDEAASEACRKLVDTYLHLNKLQNAAEWCEKGLQVTHPSDQETRVSFLDDLTRIFNELGDGNKAEEYSREISSLSPDYAEPASISVQFENPMNSVRYLLRPKRGIEGNDQPILYTEYGEATIGRMDKNDIVVASARVSKEHARMRISPQGIFLTCLSKTNGTYINGERLETGREYQIYPGDHIGLGRSIEFELIQNVQA